MQMGISWEEVSPGPPEVRPSLHQTLQIIRR
jgi:hypothetical protein